MTNINYTQLWKDLPFDINANLEFARLIYEDEEAHNIRYFFDQFSIPILKWIALNVYSGQQIDKTLPNILGMYLTFLWDPKKWYQLKQYSGSNNLKLANWLKRNGVQWFTRKVSAENKRENQETDLIDYVDYNSLLSLSCYDENDKTDEELTRLHKLKHAWGQLNDQDKDILEILVIQKLHWSDAFEELNQYMNPIGGREQMQNWDDRHRQRALSALKARAILHLTNLFNQA